MTHSIKKCDKNCFFGFHSVTLGVFLLSKMPFPSKRQSFIKRVNENKKSKQLEASNLTNNEGKTQKSAIFVCFLILAELERLRLENEAQQRVIEAQQQKLEGTAETFCCLQAAELVTF